MVKWFFFKITDVWSKQALQTYEYRKPRSILCFEYFNVLFVLFAIKLCFRKKINFTHCRNKLKLFIVLMILLVWEKRSYRFHAVSVWVRVWVWVGGWLSQYSALMIWSVGAVYHVDTQRHPHTVDTSKKENVENTQTRKLEVFSPKLAW